MHLLYLAVCYLYKFSKDRETLFHLSAAPAILLYFVHRGDAKQIQIPGPELADRGIAVARLVEVTPVVLHVRHVPPPQPIG